MKKIFLAVALACTVSFAFAQNNILTSKNGTPILPEENDWAIGFDASPFLDVIKGLFTSSDTSGSDYSKFTKDHPLAIYGKLVRNNHKVWRCSARIHLGSDKTNYVTLLDSANGASFSTQQYGNDIFKDSHRGISLGFGIEQHKGKGRVQGYFGPEINIGFSFRKATINYANAITTENTVPTISSAFVIQPDNSRITETNYGSRFNFKLRAFIGLEYFFMAKASVGAEFGWGIGYTSGGEPSSTTERWDENLNSGAGGVNKQRIPGDNNYVGKTSGFNLDADNAYGALNLIFYFGTSGGSK